MTTVLVTGAAGFIGRNLVQALGRRQGIKVYTYDLGNTAAELGHALAEADVVYHLAGVNRPPAPEEYEASNAGLTREICARLERLGRAPTVVLSSSIQAELDNPYGVSKRHAEEEVARFAGEGGGRGIIFRLKNVFGKWCRPNYNSVVATFCHNIAHRLPIAVAGPARELSLVYIDDVVRAFLAILDEAPRPGACEYREVTPAYQTTVGVLVQTIESFRAMRSTLVLPDFADPFVRSLYATYLSYLPTDAFAYPLDIKVDNRGCLAEFIKSPHAGQIFVSRTGPGSTRGNHYHDTKVEKVLVLEGEAAIRFRHIHSGEVITYRASGTDLKVLDIPPGYTHSIENVGNTELVLLCWAGEIFDPDQADTYYDEVCRG